MNSTDFPNCTGDEHENHAHASRSRTELERAAKICAAMGDPERLRLLELLLDGAHCVSELTAETSDSMSLVSQRLKVLAGADIVARRRDGKHVYYSLRDEHVRQMVANLFSHSDDNHA